MSAQRSVKSGLVWTGAAPVSPSQSSDKRRGIAHLAFTVLGVALVTAAFGAGVAQAEAPKLISYGNFTAQRAFPFGGPIGVAVDQSSGAVYVGGLLDFSEPFPYNSNIEAFDKTNKPISSAFGEGHDASLAVDAATGFVDELSNGFVEPTTAIKVYDPSTGALKSSFSVPASENHAPFSIEQIATDATGNVYVPEPLASSAPNDQVLEYPPGGCESAPLPCPKIFTGGTGSGQLKEPTGVAVDSSGNLWVADHGNNRIEELDPSGVPVEVNGKRVEISSEGVEAVALDGHNDVLTIVRNAADPCGEVKSPCQHLVEYSASIKHEQLADVGAGSIGSNSGEVSSMVAVNQSSGRVYVTDAFKGVVWVFGPPTAPVVANEFTAEVSTSEAKLGARVNPGGIEANYEFEYGTTTVYGGRTPIPPGSVGEGLAVHTVWAAASGLAAGTPYHYRVVATNELGTSYGPDQTFRTLTAEEAECEANEQFRTGFSAKLPDCRAYELVVAPTKNSSQLKAGSPSVAGNAFGFTTEAEVLPGALSGGHSYLSRREAGAWAYEALLPLEASTGIECPEHNSSAIGSSEDMSKTVLFVGADTRASKGGTGESYESCNAEGLAVVSGEPLGYENLLLRINGEHVGQRYRLINTPPPGVTPADAHFKGASADLSHVFFSEESTLGVPGASYGVENLFEWDEGTLRLLTRLPDGTPTTGSLVAMSAEGSHILFASSGALYDRVDGERTVQVDKAQGGSGASGGGAFKAASADGSTVFFLDESRLTAGSTAEAGAPDLYECTLPAGASKCELTDLTVATGGEHADVYPYGVFLGSRDSTHVYFIAKGVLASNKREYEYTDAENVSHKVIEKAGKGENNLYVAHDGTIVFVATLSNTDAGNGSVSPDGQWLAFNSRKSLTGYDNIQAGNGQLANEIYLYDATSGQIACVSCDPTGEPPVSSGAELQPSGRPLSDSGHVFFQTEEALLPSDTNDQADVYEYEDGQASLLSSGTSASDSQFEGASESGSDVFFESTQALVPLDTQEGAHVVYDAKVDGGFPFVAPSPECTTPEGCRGVASSQASLYGAPASQTFSGAGNLVPPPKMTVKKAKPKKKARCKKGFVKRKGKFVKRKGKCVKSKRSRKVKRSRRARKSNHRGGR